MKLLYIGEFPPPNGGITLLVKCLYDELNSREAIDIQKLDLVQPRKRRVGKINFPTILDNMLAFLIFQIKFLFKLRGVNVVSIHLPSKKILSYGAFALIISKLLGKKIIIRKFAGTDINGYRFAIREIIKFVLKMSDAYLCETKHLVNVAVNDKISPTFWFPNHRKVLPIQNFSIKKDCRRIVFLGLVCKEKGVEDLCNAAQNFENVKVDIFGPLKGDVSEEFMNACENVNYIRALDIGEIVDTLSKYDALILPSYREGYPGVIIEAYSVGIPVITTNLPSLKEIVDDSTGILTTPGSIDEISDAVNLLSRNSALYLKKQKGARMSAELFSVKYWADEFEGICKEVMRGK